MFTNLKYLLPAVIAVFAFTNGYSQDIVNIAETDNVDGVQCSSSVIITDSNSNNGNYGANENHQITLCRDAGSETPTQVVISPELNGDVWDVDANSSLFIYNGPNTSSPLIGVFNSVDFPAGVIAIGTGQCLTLVFVSGNGSSGAGFTATFSCIQPLQDFNFTLTAGPNLGQFHDLTHDAINICFGDSITIHTETNYPLSDAGGNGYDQSDATSSFQYLMGDGTIYQGVGLTDISHTYTNPFGYLVTIIVTDVNGKVKSDQLYVLIAPRPNFSNLAVDDTLCIGAETTISGGIFEGDTLGISPSSSAILGGGILGEQLYLPDGTDDVYETTINIDEFDDDQVIQSATDIVNFCVNMEHSYLGDLEMMLTCPDGTNIIVFNSYNLGNVNQLFPGGFGGGGIYLGDAHDGPPDGVPGVGFDYCFSDDATTGTFANIYNNPTYQEFASDGSKTISAGEYLPEESFDNFIGCPINGDWTLTVMDSWGSDDGFIFNWSIYFDPNINPSTVYYSPDIDSVYWASNADIIQNLGTSIVVQPSQEGNNSFTFFAVDEFGCLHDTVVNVYVRPEINLEDDIACDLTQILNPIDDLNEPVKDGVYTILSAPTPTATLVFEELSSVTDLATANEYGVYNIRITSEDCGYTDDAIIDYRPDPKVEPFVMDTTLCIGASIVLDAGAQDANSGNFDITWISSTAGVINTTDYSVEVNQTGEYSVIIVGHCGVAGDTINVIAITMDFEGNTICGLQSAASANVAPEGSGFWSAAENISFTNANQTGTQISSSTFGTYPITYTDYRCVDDGVTRDITFVEQPEVKVLPANPDFCADKQSLTLSTVVTGSHNGSYAWSINGTPEIGDNDSLFFPVAYFTPLEDYVIRVTVRDFYNVCQLATGEASFTGRQCEYNIPNVVTPNADGKNDKFHVEYIELFPGTKLRVYDRWGKMIFEQADYDKYQASNGGWDPSDVNSGTYFFELLIPYAETMESGYIQILKEGSGD